MGGPMIPFRADLHCHTTCSDGSYSPERLVQLAKDIGLNGLSITDHDSISAYPIALPLAKKLGIDMISGAEFSSVHQGVSVHILAYSFDLENPSIHSFCKQHIIRREKRNMEILERLSKHGVPVTMEEVLECAQSNNGIKRRTIGRPHIAIAMMKKGYVSSINEAFKKYLAEGKPCYAPGASFTPEETLDVIHQAKGLGFIAHPHLLQNQKTLQDLLKMKFDGLECYYAIFARDQQERWIKMAKKKNLLISGGSDFHGDIKPNIPLGASWVDEERFRILQKHYLANC